MEGHTDGGKMDSGVLFYLSLVFTPNGAKSNPTSG